MAALAPQTRKDLAAVAVTAPLVALFAIALFALAGVYVQTSLGPGFVAGFPLVRSTTALVEGRRYKRYLPRALALSILGVAVAAPATISHRFVIQFPFLTLGLAIAAFGTLPMVRFDLANPRASTSPNTAVPANERPEA